MTNPAIQYGSQIAADTRSGPSPSIWGNCPWLEIVTQMAEGVGGTCWYDDFTNLGTITNPTADAQVAKGSPLFGFGSSGSTITKGTDDELILTSAATQDLGGSISMGNDPYVISNVSGELWFEARIRTSTITTLERPFIIGLSSYVASAITVPLIAAGGGLKDNADTDFVGFQRVEADTTTYDTTHKAGAVTQVIHDNGVGALAVNTYVKLGMHFNIVGDKKVHFYTNGVEHPTAHTVIDALGTSFPSDVGLRLIYAYINGSGAAAATSSIDWWRVAQVIA